MSYEYKLSRKQELYLLRNFSHISSLVRGWSDVRLEDLCYKREFQYFRSRLVLRALREVEFTRGIEFAQSLVRHACMYS